MYEIPNSPNIIGDAFRDAVQGFTHLKMNQLHQRQQQTQQAAKQKEQQSYITNFLMKNNVSPEKAQAFAALPEGLQSELVKSGILSSLQSQPEMGAQPQEDLSQLLAQPAQQNQLPTHSFSGKDNGMNQQAALMSALSGGIDPTQAQRILLGGGQAQQPKAGIQQPVAQQQKPAVMRTRANPAGQPTSLMTAKERTELVKSQREQQKTEKSEQKVIDQQVKPYAEMLDKKGGAAAKEADMVLDRMSKLIDSGNLTGATMYNFRKKMEHAGHIVGGGIGTAVGAIGGGIAGSIVPGLGTATGAGIGATTGAGIGTAVGEALMPKFVGSKEDQEFTKLSLSFMNKLKDIFGGRVAIQEMQMFMDSIPTLALTDEGKKQVIKDMKLISSGWRHQKQIKDKIVAANKGHYPVDLEQQIESISKPFMDKIAKDFIG